MADWLLKTYRGISFYMYGSSNFTRAAFLNSSKTFDPKDTEVDLTGKHCVITGANQGIGFAAAELYASRGATVHLVVRNKERGDKAAQDLVAKTKNQNVLVEVLDVSSLAQVRGYAQQYIESKHPLHVLVNNAGVMQPLQKTPEGLEMNFATNVAGPFLLTELLLPVLQKSGPAAVIMVATGGVLTEPLTEDLQAEKMRPFAAERQYSRNKRVQLALAEKWTELYTNKGVPVSFYTMHPGWVDTEVLKQSMPGFYKMTKAKLRTPAEGADTIFWLGAAPPSKLASGSFYFDRQDVAKTLPGSGIPHAHNPALVDTVYSAVRALAGLEPLSTA